jgi:hypothetical protein
MHVTLNGPHSEVVFTLRTDEMGSDRAADTVVVAADMNRLRTMVEAGRL